LSEQGVRVQGSAYSVKVADKNPAASKDANADKAAAKAAKPADAAAKPAPVKN
jgi:hypothetical protein